MARKKKVTRELIISGFMDHVLKNGEKPKSVFMFCEAMNIHEPDFYNLFNSFEQIEREIYATLLSKTIETLEIEEEVSQYTPKEKLLGLYFTFIENLTANRSYIQMSIKDSGPLENMKVMKEMKKVFINYISRLEFETLDLKQENLMKIQQKSIDEFLWVQLLIIMKFWLNDESRGFEKTDIFIEKTVHASFDLMNTQPVKSFLDLGKFLLKEKMNLKI